VFLTDLEIWLDRLTANVTQTIRRALTTRDIVIVSRVFLASVGNKAFDAFRISIFNRAFSALPAYAIITPRLSAFSVFTRCFRPVFRISIFSYGGVPFFVSISQLAGALWAAHVPNHRFFFLARNAKATLPEKIIRLFIALLGYIHS